MPQYNRAELGRMATESGFVRDTFEKGFKLPFGIHVKIDKQCEVINRGCPKDITRLTYGSTEIRGIM